MADADRRTTIDGDQITDNTVSSEEMKTTGTPEEFKMMTYNPSTGGFTWFHFIRGRIFQ